MEHENVMTTLRHDFTCNAMTMMSEIDSTCKLARQKSVRQNETMKRLDWRAQEMCQVYKRLNLQGMLSYSVVVDFYGNSYIRKDLQLFLGFGDIKKV